MTWIEEMTVWKVRTADAAIQVAMQAARGEEVDFHAPSQSHALDRQRKDEEEIEVLDHALQEDLEDPLQDPGPDLTAQDDAEDETVLNRETMATGFM